MRPPCTRPDCAKPTNARGLCSMHYKRWRLYGDPDATPRYERDPVTRFWSKVDRSGDCWLYTGNDNGRGYGVFIMGRRSLGQRVNVYAHRYAYELLVGPIPDGLHIDHLCRIRNCVNPAHMEPVTSAENTRRGPGAKTHCDYGHEFTPENTYRQPSNGRRACQTCKRIRNMGITAPMHAAMLRAVS